MGRATTQNDYVIFQLKAKPEEAGILEFEKIGTNWDQVGDAFSAYNGFLYDIQAIMGEYESRPKLRIRLIFLSEDRKRKEVFDMTNNWVTRSIINRVFKMGKEARKNLALIKVFKSKGDSGKTFPGATISYGSTKIDPWMDASKFNNKYNGKDADLEKLINKFRATGTLPGEDMLNSDLITEEDTPVKNKSNQSFDTDPEPSFGGDDTPGFNDNDEPGFGNGTDAPSDANDFEEADDDDDLPF